MTAALPNTASFFIAFPWWEGKGRTMLQSSTTRRSAALVLGLLALLVIAAPASAGRMWCARDPIVRIQGTDLQILIAVPQEYADYVNGPIQVDIRTPDWAPAELIFADAGFNGHGEVVTFSKLPGSPAYDSRKTQTNVSVIVPIAFEQLPANTQVSVQVKLIPSKGLAKTKNGNSRGTAVGTALASTN
jgi:hypothetical protein